MQVVAVSPQDAGVALLNAADTKHGSVACTILLLVVPE